MPFFLEYCRIEFLNSSCSSCGNSLIVVWLVGSLSVWCDLKCDCTALYAVHALELQLREPRPPKRGSSAHACIVAWIALN